MGIVDEHRVGAGTGTTSIRPFTRQPRLKAWAILQGKPQVQATGNDPPTRWTRKTAREWEGSPGSSLRGCHLKGHVVWVQPQAFCLHLG